MCPEEGEKCPAHVLCNQREHRHDAQDEKWLSTLEQGTELGRKPDGREEYEEQGIAGSGSEHDFRVEHELADQDRDGDNHRTDDRVRHIDLAQNRNGLTDCPADQQR